MTTNTTTRATIIHYTQRGFAVFSLAALALVALFAFEAAPLRGTVPEALAWSCTLQADSVATAAGADVTLSWTSASDVSYITIDYFPGEQFPRNGTRDVSITETTTFTAYTHVTWTTDTLKCKVTVTVTPPPVDECEDVVLSINDDSFTWSGGILEEYTVEFCDGTEQATEYVCYPNGETISFDKRIKSVKACGDDCYREATQDCPPPPPEDPLCDMSAVPTTITAGSESVISWWSTRADHVVFDGLTSALLEGSLAVSPATTTTYTGTFYGAEGTEEAVCSVVITVVPVVVPENPVCTIAANPSTIQEGGQSTITWTSDHATSVVWSGLASELLDGSLAVSPATTTTYTGTFKGAQGTQDAICTTVVTVVPEPDEPLPVCTMNITPSQVSKGGSATIAWTSDNATTAGINQGVGSVALDGTLPITVNDNITYTGTFTNSDGVSVMCSASASVTTGGGGGGRCLNCDDDDDDRDEKKNDKDPKPSIVLSAKTTKPTSITLAQVPYTGFKATPLMTTFFWIAVLMISAAIAYTVTLFRNRRTAVSTALSLPHVTTDTAVTYSTVATSIAMPVRSTARVDPVALAHAQGASDAHAHIEEVAHGDNILLSPEATRMIAATLMGTAAAQDEQLRDIFDRAKAAYPREDGWILLSKERCAKLLEAQAPVSTPVVVREEIRTAAQPVRATAAPARATDTVVSTFVRSLATNDQPKTFELLRNISAQGVDIGTFIGRVVRDLDEVYKHRIEGNRKPDQALVALTEAWNAGTFETVLGALVECIDYSYTNTRIGAKVALAKVFEQFASLRR